MDGPSLYYGMNALSHNVIMADRKKLKSANGLYLGSTGSGKSFAAKRELLNVFLAIPQDRIIVVDPMGEYAPLVERLGGQVIEIAPDSPNHISPMDVQMDMGGGDSPLSLKADFLLSLCELSLIHISAARRPKASLFPAAHVWPPLTSPSFGRSCPMTSWSLTCLLYTSRN